MTRCAHLSPEFAADFKVTMPGAEPMETCLGCAKVLRGRFMNRQDVTFEMLRSVDSPEAATIKAEDAPATPANDYERVMIKQLSRCSLRINSFDKAFLATVNNRHTAAMLSPKGRALVALLMWRYRGQLPAFGERDKKYLQQWLQGKARQAFLLRRN